MRSIRQFLLGSTLAVMILMFLITAFVTYKNTQADVNRIFDGQLAESIYLLERMHLEGIKTPDHEVPPELTSAQYLDDAMFHEKSLANRKAHHAYELKRVFQVWNTQGHLLARAVGAPPFPFSDLAPGFSMTQMGNDTWHTYTLHNEVHGLIYVMAQRHDIRTHLARHIALNSLFPYTFIFPIIMIVLWLTIGYSLKPIQKIREQLDKRQYNQLDALSDDQIPEEIAPLIDATNALFVRLNASYEREKRFAADAAHELRTPLAAIKTMSQLAVQSNDINACHETLHDVIKGVNRATHVVKQLAVLNSLRPEHILHEVEWANLGAVVPDVLVELHHAAQAKGITLHAEVDESLSIRANVPCIQIMLRNVVDNAIRYTPEGGHIWVKSRRTEKGVELCVEDNGPGIPETLRHRVFERFYRQLGTQENGSGLGLSIVALICTIHNADIDLDTPESGQGLAVKIQFAA